MHVYILQYFHATEDLCTHTQVIQSSVLKCNYIVLVALESFETLRRSPKSNSWADVEQSHSNKVCIYAHLHIWVSVHVPTQLPSPSYSWSTSLTLINMLFDSTGTFLDPNKLCVISCGRLPVLALNRLTLSLFFTLAISSPILGGTWCTYITWNVKGDNES